MRVLGIDTSGHKNTVGITDGEQILADFSFEARADSLKQIIANIDFALKNVRLTLGDIQGLGVGLGPGSWTGIRIGVTVGKILAYSTGKPIVGVPTLEALAYNARDRAAPICAIIGAGTGDMVYAACYSEGNGTLSRLGDYYVGDIPGLSAALTEASVCISSGVKPDHRQQGQISSLTRCVEAIDGEPSGSAVALLAAGRLEQGYRDDFLALAPLYLKESTTKAFQGRYIRGKGQD